MPGLLRGVARTAVVAGTWTAVSNGVSRRQAGRWAAQAQSPAPAQGQSPAPADGQAGAAAQQAYARQLATPPPPGRYRRPLFQPAPPPARPPAPPAPYQAPPAPAPAGAAPDAGPSMDAKLSWLRQLGELKAQGVLSDAEVEAQKRAILGD